MHEKRTLITGATGQLGSYLFHELRESGSTEFVRWTRLRTGADQGLQSVDLRDTGAVAAAIRAARPNIIVHAAAMASVAECSRDPAGAAVVNVLGSAAVARFAREVGSRLVHVSTDMVFDGEHAPYRESDAAAAISVYGWSKVEAEQMVVAEHPQAAIVRVSLLYGPSLSDRPTFFDTQRRTMAEGGELALFDDEWRTPLDLPTAAKALIAIANSDFSGVLHVGGPERLSRLEMGKRLAAALGCHARISPVSRNSARDAEPRPRDVSLDSSRWRSLFPSHPWPTFHEALAAMLGG